MRPQHSLVTCTTCGWHSAETPIVRDYLEWNGWDPATVRTMAPLGGSGATRPEWMRFARLIHRPGRILGVPSARAAFGGNPSLPWLPRTVVRPIKLPWHAWPVEL